MEFLNKITPIFLFLVTVLSINNLQGCSGLPVQGKNRFTYLPLICADKINLLLKLFVDSNQGNQLAETTLDFHVRQIVQEELDKMIPDGFIYVQYPGQPSPQTLWPLLKWNDVSDQYAGHFFRVVGGNAAEFGKAQGENVPRLSHVNSRMEKATGQSERKDIDISPGQTSARLWTGDDVGGKGTLISTSFTMTGGEVRPKNFAVRVWKRV